MWKQQEQPCYPITVVIPILICKFPAMIGKQPIKPGFDNWEYLESFYPLHLRRICPKVGCHYGHPERLLKHWVLRLNSFPPPVWMLEQYLISPIEKNTISNSKYGFSKWLQTCVLFYDMIERQNFENTISFFSLKH